MKAIYKTVTCLLLVSFLVAGVTVVPRLADPKIVSAQPLGDGDPLADLLTVVAKKVSEIPAIDGDFSDPAWAEAMPTKFAGTVWKAVYTDDELAMYIRWPDHDASIDSRGTWNWDSEKQSWWRTGWEPGTLPSYKGQRHPEWFNISFDISSTVSTASMTEEGCGAFCHEYPPGSGQFHHQTNATEAYIDSWIILAKHGYGRYFHEDMGWLQGVTRVSQEGEIIFNPSDPHDIREPINGSFTFVGYAEDKVMASPDDLKFAARDTLADQFCRDCHEQLGVPGDPLKVNYTYGDPGDPMYVRNWDDAHAVPLYMETNPEDFVDCMVLTQAEIDAGEAVLVADLSAAELTEYWNNYAALNGNIPQLILQEPSGDQADVRAAANWYDGYWTVELKRALVTGSDYDVQFDDLSKGYHFGVTLWTHVDSGGGFRYNPWTLRFEQ